MDPCDIKCREWKVMSGATTLVGQDARGAKDNTFRRLHVSMPYTLRIVTPFL